MIFLYSGTPGSGKSLHLARQIVGWCGHGKPCIGNFPVALRRGQDNYVFRDNLDLSPDWLASWAVRYWHTHPFREGGIRLIIDEAQIMFNARSWDAKGRADWVRFFTQHRKYGYDIFLVAQFDRMLDRQVRSLIEYEIIHRKMSNFGIRGRLLSLVYGGAGFLAVKTWYPIRQKVGSEAIRYSKRFASVYDTLAVFDGGDHIDQPRPEPISAEVGLELPDRRPKMADFLQLKILPRKAPPSGGKESGKKRSFLSFLPAALRGEKKDAPRAGVPDSDVL